jgi:Fe2+ or Zn2+ uptake regulation protein
MNDVETKIHRRTTANDPALKNAILHILLHEGDSGMDAATLLQEVSNAGIKLEYKGLLYKSLRILVNSGKLERFYSHKKCIAYRIRKE